MSTPKKPAAKKPAAKKVRCRVTAVKGDLQPNDVITLSEAAAEAAVAEGWADSSAAAVRFAAKLPQNKK